jgi:hypothetical protein
MVPTNYSLSNPDSFLKDTRLPESLALSTWPALLSTMATHLGGISLNEGIPDTDSVFPCQYWVNKQRWYNLKPLQKPDFYDLEGYLPTERVLVNFCLPFTAASKYPTCDQSDRFGYMIIDEKNNQTCSSLTGNHEAGHIKFKEIFSTQDTLNPIGVQLDFPFSEGECPTGSTSKPGLRIMLYCDETLSSGWSSNIEFYREEPFSCT